MNPQANMFQRALIGLACFSIVAAGLFAAADATGLPPGTRDRLARSGLQLAWQVQFLGQ